MRKIKKFPKLFLYFTIFVTSMEIPASEKTDQFVGSLPQEQRITLEYFSKNLLESLAGYVLFGDKPMCTSSVYEPLNIPSNYIYSGHMVSAKGFEFLSELNIEKEDKKFTFVECKQGETRDLIFINKNAFIKVVNENIFLFRYILGRTLTAESLLNELLNSGDKFYDIIKWNKLIIGILLGYGTQNALLVSRGEDLRCELADNRNPFPFKDYETFISFQRTPSLGFKNLEDEFNNLYNSVQISTHLKQFSNCRIPHFACEPNSNETLNLLSTYEKNRENILKIIEEGDHLTKLLDRLCMTVDDTISVPQSFSRKIPKLDQDLSSKLAEFKNFDLSRNSKEIHLKKHCAIEAFLQGIECFEKGWECEYSPIQSSPEALNQYLNVRAAKKFMKKIIQQENAIQLIPEQIFHRVLVNGKGVSASDKIKNATFSFALYDMDNHLNECGTIKKSSLMDLIPGIAHSLMGMKRDEEREIYIHPNYAYGFESSEGKWTIANVKLLDFEEGEEKAILPNPYTEVIPEFPKSFLLDYSKWAKNRFFCEGYYFWKMCKEMKLDLDLMSFSKILRSDSRIFRDEDEMRKFIIEFNSLQFSRGYERGERPNVHF